MKGRGPSPFSNQESSPRALNDLSMVWRLWDRLHDIWGDPVLNERFNLLSKNCQESPDGHRGALNPLPAGNLPPGPD